METNINEIMRRDFEEERMLHAQLVPQARPETTVERRTAEDDKWVIRISWAIVALSMLGAAVAFGHYVLVKVDYARCKAAWAAEDAAKYQQNNQLVNTQEKAKTK